MVKKNIERVLLLIKKSQEGLRKTTLNREAKDQKNFTSYQTLVSCILSLRAKDEITEKISSELFKIADTPEKMISLSNEKLEKIIFSSGYYKNKTKALKKLSEQIIHNYNGKVPESEEELLGLYGVGRKTANIVRCFSFDQNVIPIDTHCHRIPNRLGWIKTKNPEETEKELMKIIPKELWREVNGIFVLFGKTICLPISPLCSQCPVRDYCERRGVGKSR